MIKKLIILCVLLLAGCAPSNNSPAGGEPNCCGLDAEGERIFQKGSQSVTAPSNLVGVWELPSDVQPTSVASVRVVITESTMTIAGKCEFLKDGRAVETLYAVATTPSSFTEDTLSTEKDVEQTKTSGDRECRVYIKAAANKYVIHPETKTFCIMRGSRCVATFTKIAD